MSERNLLADASFADLRQRLAELNRQGDLDAIPVAQEQQPDDTNWLQRFRSFVMGGGPWGTAQPGQRGAWVPSQVNAQGKAELAVPGIVQQPAESLQALMTAPLSDIVRSGDRDAIRAAAEASFDVAGALPAAGAALGRVNAGARAKEIGPLYRGSSGKLADADPQREFYWTTPDRKLASSYAEETLPSSTASKRGTMFDRWGNQVFSNPDDPTTAAILALLSAQQGGQQQQ